MNNAGQVAQRPPLVLHVFSTFAVGGPQVRFCTMAERFGSNCRHAIVALDGDTSCRERLRRDLVIDYLAIPTHKGDVLGNVLRYRRILRELNPDVLVTYNWGAIEWAMANRLVGIRHIHIEDGFGPDERDRQLPRRVWTRRLVLRQSTVVLPSRTLERIALGIWWLPRRHVRFIPNGIDLTRFAPRPAEAKADIPTIGTVAALRPEKNLARLLRAFAIARRAHPARLVIVGDGPELAALNVLADSLGITEHVSLTGHMLDVQGAYRRFDIYALSSDTEQMPLSILEAMATGLPIVSTDVGDLKLMLPESSRRFVVGSDDHVLASALSELLSDPRLCSSLGAANRVQAVAEFDEKKMLDSYAAVLNVPCH